MKRELPIFSKVLYPCVDLKHPLIKRSRNNKPVFSRNRSLLNEEAGIQGFPRQLVTSGKKRTLQRLISARIIMGYCCRKFILERCFRGHIALSLLLLLILKVFVIAWIKGRLYGFEI